MFSHVMVGTNDLEASKKFYDAVLGTLGISPGFIDEDRRFHPNDVLEQAAETMLEELLRMHVVLSPLRSASTTGDS